MPNNIEISELPYKSIPEANDNIIIENLNTPEPTSRTSLDQVKESFAGNIAENDEGFVKGNDVHKKVKAVTEDLHDIVKDITDKLENKVSNEEGKGLSTNDYTDQEKQDVKNIKERFATLNLSDISNTNDIPVWERPIAELLKIGTKEFNSLRYRCCLASAELEDFPDSLKETDTVAYVITHRNGKEGFQLVIGQSSGQIITRSQSEKGLTKWTKSSEMKLVDSYNSDLTDTAPTADALRRAFMMISDRILELDMIVKGGDISVFPYEIIFPPEGGSATLIIKAKGTWTIY